MTEQEWLKCRDPRRMLYHLAGGSEGLEGERSLRIASGRKFRLICCAMSRPFFFPEHTEDIERILDAEKVADCEVGSMERGMAFNKADTMSGYRGVLARACLRSSAAAGPYQLANEPTANNDLTHTIWANTIREIAGNPFRPIAREHNTASFYTGPVLKFSCVTPTVLSLVQAAYDERQPDGTLDPLRLAVLADALEEAGCETHDGVCPECNGSGELGTLGGRIGCYVCAPDYQTRGTGRSNRRMLRCKCGGSYGIVKKDLFPAPLSSCQKCWADGPPWSDVIRGEVPPHPILAHLRSPGTHWRGCWAVDLILGKE